MSQGKILLLILGLGYFESAGCLAEKPLVKFEAATSDDASVRVKGFKPVVQEGRLPPPWSVVCWDASGEVQASFETVRGHRALRVVNVTGASGQLYTYQPIPVSPDRCYDIRIEYLLGSKGEAKLVVKNGAEELVSARIRSSEGVWKTGVARFDTRQDQLEMYLQCAGRGESESLSIKSVELFEMGPSRGEAPFIAIPEEE